MPGRALIIGFALMAPAMASAAELRSGTVRYDGGAASYPAAESQYVICDDCPPRRPLVPMPVKPPTPAQPVAPDRLSVEGVIPSPFDHRHVHNSSEKAQEPAKPAAIRPLATVYFTINSARLHPAEKRRLRTAAEAGGRSEVIVRVEGHTCRIGTAAFNRKLSIRRAHAVSSYLKSLGVPVKEVAGFGKTQPLGGSLSRDRRAEIVIKERNYIP